MPCPIRLFFYGTLRDPDLLVRLTRRTVSLTPATLHGWRRVALPGGRYPTLCRTNGFVDGVLAIVDRPSLARLSVYEGPLYRLTPVIARTAGGILVARAWIAPGGTRRAWP